MSALLTAFLMAQVSKEQRSGSQGTAAPFWIEGIIIEYGICINQREEALQQAIKIRSRLWGAEPTVPVPYHNSGSALFLSFSALQLLQTRGHVIVYWSLNRESRRQFTQSEYSDSTRNYYAGVCLRSLKCSSGQAMRLKGKSIIIVRWPVGFNCPAGELQLRDCFFSSPPSIPYKVERARLLARDCQPANAVSTK